MAFMVMVVSLNITLRDLLKMDCLNGQMEVLALLWGRITVHVTEGDGVNPDYILHDLLNHKLKLGQTMEAYVVKSES
ncbi:hypothetical protein PF005_g3221 [Phytophthora fragariae]|nr:hypothetical protein PF003_g17552 [Phytophthora fragariae]KAE9133596.1 hypothetical protein PF010_g2767 [Phytophthora fragariae]KAE9231132.1 hypothetical protein PF005_g3221 [Phytophthora fragariae]KAE9241881.1 hypothetical protein PF004_g6854 [Phytophthora fragariae]KAE9325781.1 hypothetical protein PF001_g2757 [Phytophthora fragariae]